MLKTFSALLAFALLLTLLGTSKAHAQEERLVWNEVAQLPDGSGGEGQGANLGMAGPFVGVHNDHLIVAGGANFPIPTGHGLWDTETYKQYYDIVWVLSRKENEEGYVYNWIDVDATLPTPRAYGTTLSTDLGVLCVGGINQPRDAQGNELTDAQGETIGDPVFADAFFLRWDTDKKAVIRIDLPPLPVPSVNGSGAVVGNTAYIIVGQTDTGLDSATDRMFALDLSRLSIGGSDVLTIASKTDDDGNEVGVWKEVAPIPGGARAHTMVAAQHNGRETCLYVIGGRRAPQENEDTKDMLLVNPDGSAHWLLYHDVWEFNPNNEASPWRQRADIEINGQVSPLTAGAAVPIGPSHIYVVSGSTGENISDAMSTHQVGWADYYDENGASRHAGFSRAILSYHAITDAWATVGQAPTMDDPQSGAAVQIAVNAVTTRAVRWGDEIIIASGEVRPKIRSPKIWAITVKPHERKFGALNMAVLIVYLLAMVGVGVFFVFKNKNTDDYFRGGQNIPWWAAACSIYATMLSSLTYVALPALVFATDWLLYPGMFLILATAPIAVYIAMPFFRRIDATSAYEYLGKRFNLPVRLFGSGLFTLFHISRMGIVMALTALALSAVTPLSPAAAVLIMGGLCLIYCTLGGIEAVIWTDTIQTFVLLGGAVLCFIFIISGIDGGLSGFVQAGQLGEKFKMVNLDFGAKSFTTLALWVIILGGLGQNIVSYTSDQAVIQRYMTTKDTKAAAKSIWANGIMAIPGSLLFFLIGTGLYAFYQSNPGKLDPTIQNDQVFPMFIGTELPAGIAGLIVAGIFAAAQSTVSTSMNSTSTTVVTDFLRPFNACKTEKGYLNAARGLTLVMGVLGTLAGLIFIDPNIYGLMEAYFKVIGMFMGALGGLFILGVLTKRANGRGAFLGTLIGVGVMYFVWRFTPLDGYLYATVGVLACLIFGYLASLVLPDDGNDVDGLTIYTMKRGGDA